MFETDIFEVTERIVIYGDLTYKGTTEETS